MTTKAFKVAAVSDNRNSFGLRQIVLLAKDGEAWKCCVGGTNERKMGDVIELPYNTQPTFATLTWSAEIPERMTNAPQMIVDQVW